LDAVNGIARHFSLDFSIAMYYPTQQRKESPTATIIRKNKKGHTYYYAVQSKRVNGKPRIVWQKYLGTIDAILHRAEDATPAKPFSAVINEAGGVAALLSIAQRIRLVDLINEAVPKRDQGPSVGQYMLLAALNRALDPCSKKAIGAWYDRTALRRLWGYPPVDFSSQRFWDHMDMVSDDAIETVQGRLLETVRREYGIDTRVLLYDTTNFFTFLATTNPSELAQRGRNKAKRRDLRQIGLALLVSRDFHIPLLHRVYPGNVNDVALFPDISRDLIARFTTLTGQASEPTAVWDRGNISDYAMQHYVVSGMHFVAGLPADRFPGLLATPLERFEQVPGCPGTRAFAATDIVWAKDCKIVVVYTESFFAQQAAGVMHNLVKCQKRLADLERSLRPWHQGKGRGKPPTAAGVRKAVRTMLSAQFMKEIVSTAISEENGWPVLQHSVDHQALDRLNDRRLGRTLLITDHLDWPVADVITTYRGLAAVEDAFRNMKNIHFLHWQPAYHWTDQKLRVHGFYCVLGLLLATLARLTAARSGIEITVPRLLEELSLIREVAVIYPPGTPGARKSHPALSSMSPRQHKLADCFGIAEILAEG